MSKLIFLNLIIKILKIYKNYLKMLVQNDPVTKN